MQSTQSAVCFEPVAIGVDSRGTEIRSVTILVPLGSSRSAGAVETLPRSRTELALVALVVAASGVVVRRIGNLL